MKKPYRVNCRGKKKKRDRDTVASSGQGMFQLSLEDQQNGAPEKNGGREEKALKQAETPKKTRLREVLELKKNRDSLHL